MMACLAGMCLCCCAEGKSIFLLKSSKADPFLANRSALLSILTNIVEFNSLRTFTSLMYCLDHLKMELRLYTDFSAVAFCCGPKLLYLLYPTSMVDRTIWLR